MIVQEHNMKLELYPLKLETTYKGKSYYIEASRSFNNTVELKWYVVSDAKLLSKDYKFIANHLKDKDNYIFDTKDEAVRALEVYLLVEEQAKYLLDIKYFCSTNDYETKNKYFMSLISVEAILRRKNVKFIDLSNSNHTGVQVRIRTLKEMLNLEQAIKEIEEEESYFTVVNYFNNQCNHLCHSWPLYYYWQSDSEYIRHFAFIKKGEYWII